MMLRADNNVNNAARYCEYSLVELSTEIPKTRYSSLCIYRLHM